MVGDESEGGDERASEVRGERIVDIDVGRKRRDDFVSSRLEVHDRQGASTDRAQKRAGVLAARQYDDPSGLTLEHLSGPAGARAVAGKVTVVIESPNLVTREPSEARRGSGYFRSFQERDIDSERDMGSAAPHRTAQVRIAPHTLHGRPYISWITFSRIENRRPGRRRRAARDWCERQQESYNGQPQRRIPRVFGCFYVQPGFSGG